MANEDLFKDLKERKLSDVPARRKRRINGEWGPESVVEFLKQIVKDVEKANESADANFVESLDKNELRLVSDTRLPYLFGDKYVVRIRINELVVSQLDSNKYQEEEEENETKRKAVEAPENCFASTVPENIKLVYLKRGMVEELLMDVETFEAKVVGSYVRIKLDSDDYVPGNSHMILQVTGVRKACECGDVNAEYFLQVPHLIKEIPVSMLSNEDFTLEECDDLFRRTIAGSANRPTVEECDDLFRRTIAGSANRPTVKELHQKAQVLHKVITKQEAIKDIYVQHFQTGDSPESQPIHEAKLDFEVFQGHKNSLHEASSSQNILYELDNIVNSGSSHYNFIARSSQYNNEDHRCNNEYHQHLHAEIKEMKDQFKAMEEMKDRMKAMEDMIDRLQAIRKN